MLNIGQNRNSNIKNLEIKVYKGFFGHNQISHDSDFVTIFKLFVTIWLSFLFLKQGGLLIVTCVQTVQTHE